MFGAAPAFHTALPAWPDSHPDRSDQSDVLALCDDNLVFERNLFAGIDGGFLAPFQYYGIFDESVDYP